MGQDLRCVTAILGGRGTSHQVEFYTEYFDIARFPEARQRQAFIDLVRTRYANRKIDVVVLGGATAFDLLTSQETSVLRNGVHLSSLLVCRRLSYFSG